MIEPNPALLLAHIGHRRAAARRYINRLLSTYPSLPLDDRRQLAALLIPEDNVAPADTKP